MYNHALNCMCWQCTTDKTTRGPLFQVLQAPQGLNLALAIPIKYGSLNHWLPEIQKLVSTLSFAQASLFYNNNRTTPILEN